MSVKCAKTDDEIKEKQGVEQAKQPPSKNIRSRQARMRQQDSHWSWIVCLSALVSNVITLGGPYGFGVFLPSLLEHFKGGKALTG